MHQKRFHPIQAKKVHRRLVGASREYYSLCKQLACSDSSEQMRLRRRKYGRPSRNHNRKTVPGRQILAARLAAGLLPRLATRNRNP